MNKFNNNFDLETAGFDPFPGERKFTLWKTIKFILLSPFYFIKVVFDIIGSIIKFVLNLFLIAGIIFSILYPIWFYLSAVQ